MAAQTIAFPTTSGAAGAHPQAAAWRRSAAATDAFYAAAKRALDIAVAALLLVALVPLFTIVALAIALESRGPVIYRGERTGRYGRPFTIFKFRSMRADADPAAHATFVRDLLRGKAACTLYKLPNDGRITRVGAFLRRTSIDELPQLWNVLRGEMSLVGPRPD